MGGGSWDAVDLHFSPIFTIADYSYRRFAFKGTFILTYPASGTEFLDHSGLHDLGGTFRPLNDFLVKDDGFFRGGTVLFAYYAFFRLHERNARVFVNDRCSYRSRSFSHGVQMLDSVGGADLAAQCTGILTVSGS